MTAHNDRIRLDRLDPSEVAREAREQAWRLREQISAETETPDELSQYDLLASNVELLTQYAKTGEPATWGPDGGAIDAIQQVCALLYQSADTGAISSGELDSPSDPATTFGAVMVAVSGRIQLAVDDSIDARQLATLANISAEQVRHLGACGELEVNEFGEVRSEDALRFLGARGAAGFRR